MPEQDPPSGAELTSKFTTINIVVAGAAVLLASVALIVLQSLSLRSALLEDLGTQARIVGDNAASALLFNDADAARKTLAPLSALPNILEAELLSPKGEALASYRQSNSEVIDEPWPMKGYRFRFGSVDVVQNIEFDTQVVGVVRLRASLDQLYRRLIGYAGTTLMVSISALALSLLLVARMRKVVSRAESRLQFLAHVDSVTQLPNRHTFNERLDFAVSRLKHFPGRVALLVMDLDNFKLVNDSLGHQSGDLLLGMVAQRFSSSLRRDDIVCRIGGDEFAVILENADRDIDAVHIAEKLLNSLSLPFWIGTHEIFVSASIGLSFYPADAHDTQELIRNADAALYAAKARGKGSFELFTPAMNERAQQRLSLESRLRRALERQEFVLHYQPQVELGSGRIVGVEALLRWKDNDRLVGPNEFIPVAEESGLIVPIGEWVLQEACAQARRWLDKGLPPLRMAVNLSARQFDSDNLLEKVHFAVGAAQLHPGLVELEITESAIMHNTAASARLLQQLSGAGFKVAIDDFGTGYSSMSYLKRFPIHRLKVDRSFVTDLTIDKDDAAIVAAVVAMAHALGLEVIAEGVETREQYAKLRALGCDLGQGYLMSRPLPAADLENLLASGAKGFSAVPYALV